MKERRGSKAPVTKSMLTILTDSREYSRKGFGYRMDVDLKNIHKAKFVTSSSDFLLDIEDVLGASRISGGGGSKPRKTTTTTTTSSTTTTTTTGGTTTSSTTTTTTTGQIVVQPPTGGLPSSFALSSPTVMDQGGEGSCVAFGVGYSNWSIREYYRTAAGSFANNTNVFSPEYLYNQAKFGDCGSGTSITTVMDIIVSQGVCLFDTMPYTCCTCNTMPNGTQTTEAANYKATGYTWLYASDVAMIKTKLNDKFPVVVGIVPDQAFINGVPNVGGEYVFSAYTGAKTAGHVVNIIGWDDSIAGGSWKIQNSWGTDWGNAGLGWITYDFLPYAGNGTGQFFDN